MSYWTTPRRGQAHQANIDRDERIELRERAERAEAELKRLRAWMLMIGEHIKEQPGCFGISQLLIEEGNAQRSGTSPACTPPASGRA